MYHMNHGKKIVKVMATCHIVNGHCSLVIVQKSRTLPNQTFNKQNPETVEC